jgi:hypothetical protein
MMCGDIAMIVFVAVTANHLGLIAAIEDFFRVEIAIVNCPKCLSFWMTLGYCVFGHSNGLGLIGCLAISFLASYSAVWLELFEGFIDKLYSKAYDKIYPTKG